MFNYQSKKVVGEFIYAKFPKAFMSAENYKDMSCEAKLLYMQLLDSSNISRKNDWVDEEGRLYVKQTQESIAKYLNCGVKKVRKIVDELIIYELIERIKTGPNKPDIFYVSDITQSLKTKNLIKYLVKGKSPQLKDITNEQVQNGQLESQNHPEMVPKEPMNQKIKTIYNTDAYNSNPSIKKKKLMMVQDLSERIALVDLEEKYSDGIITNLFEIAKKVIVSSRSAYTIKNRKVSGEDLIKEIMRLEEKHFEYVRLAIVENVNEIKNIEMYAISMLFNAKSTIDIFYHNRFTTDQLKN